MSDAPSQKLIRNAFEIVIITTLLSAMLALSVISVMNDIYAFVKPEGTVMLKIAEPTKIGELSRQLQREGIIKNPTVFSLFVRSKGMTQKLESFFGEASLRKDMSYREIMLSLSKIKSEQ